MLTSGKGHPGKQFKVVRDKRWGLIRGKGRSDTVLHVQKIEMSLSGNV